MDNAFTAATTGVQRAINDVNQSYMKNVDELYYEKMRHIGTITYLKGIDKNIDKTDTEKVPTKDSSVQTIEVTPIT